MRKGAWREEWLVILPILFVTIGQIFSKRGALQAHETGIPINIPILLGYTCLLLRGVIWIFILRSVRLAYAYPLLSITYILILAISYFIFHEQVTWPRVLGCLLIMGGITAITLGEKRSGASAGA